MKTKLNKKFKKYWKKWIQKKNTLILTHLKMQKNNKFFNQLGKNFQI